MVRTKQQNSKRGKPRQQSAFAPSIIYRSKHTLAIYFYFIHATAAKLEGFITMKNRPIHNSGSKWADQATSKVKSIVKWIKTGGKNNRAVLERLEKKYREYFRHKVHKKPKKKTKGRDSSIVYSTTRQTSLGGFISFKNNLY